MNVLELLQNILPLRALEASRQKEVPVEQPFAVLPFYPSMRYIDRKWAPESSLTTEGVNHIAAARRLAEKTKVLTPELGEHLLPIAMVEGYGAEMGVRQDQAFYASRRFRDALSKMGLVEGEDYISVYLKGEKHYMPASNYKKPENSPRMAAAILGEKASVARDKGDITAEAAIKRYNGSGSGTEDVYGQPVPADVNVYWEKVKEASQMLRHPRNAAFTKHFNTRYSQ